MSGDLGVRYVMVNIPAAQIEAVDNGQVALRHTAIVGKIDRQTPILNSRIHEVILKSLLDCAALDYPKRHRTVDAQGPNLPHTKCNSFI